MTNSEKGKLCPLLRANANYESDCWCLREKCMWWNEEKKDCNINVIALLLERNNE